VRRGASSVLYVNIILFLVNVTLTAGQCDVVDIPREACAASLNVNTFDLICAPMALSRRSWSTTADLIRQRFAVSDASRRPAPKRALAVSHRNDHPMVADALCWMGVGADDSGDDNPTPSARYGAGSWRTGRAVRVL
jgi:hypothetical protein